MAGAAASFSIFCPRWAQNIRDRVAGFRVAQLLPGIGPGSAARLLDRMAGIRGNGDKVRLPGLSTGAGDQLYLSLRIAAVEEYLEHAAPLPLIADDVFVNYDDDRAAAGLQVLRHLARETQVLFFTHHQHLIDVARKAVGKSVSTVSLSPRHVPSADAAQAA